MASWSGRTAVKGGSETMRMVLLTCNSIGISFTWGVEMTYCTPYLLSLGLTKGQTSLVWLAGPLSGLIVQPIIGVVSDSSTSPWGRRRPFIMACSAVVAIGLLTLGFTRDIVDAFLPSADPTGTILENGIDSRGGSLTVALAVLALYTTDFAINAVMSCARSLVVDTLPAHKQQDGAAWSSRMASVGHVLGYGAGAVDLPATLGTALGATQFKQLTLIAALGILFFSGMTCWAVSERVLVAPRPEGRPGGGEGRFKVVRQIWSTLITLPVRIRAICWAVFWSWIGWYPFLIYSSTWVGETYFRYDVPPDARDSTDALGEMGRIGSYALTVYSTIVFLGAWLLPPFVRSPDSDDDDDDAALAEPGFISRRYPELAKSLASLDHLKPDLLTVWTFGYVVFAAAMLLAPLASSFRSATALVAICGVPWTISTWAPSALLGVEVNRLTAAGTYRRLSSEALEMAELTAEESSGRMVAAEGGGGGELSGIYFGILNIYTTLPQFVGTFISAVVFAVLEPGKSPELADSEGTAAPTAEGPNAIGVCLFIGAISALGGAYATRRLRYL